MPWSGRRQLAHRPFDQRLRQAPEAIVDVTAGAVVGGQGEEQLAVVVQLKLLAGGVADAHRPRAPVPLEMVQHALLDVRLVADAVERVQVVGEGGGEVAEPAQEGRGVVGVAQAVKDVEGEGGVPQPAEAVVPVAGPADLAGQRSGDGGADSAAGRVEKLVQRENRAFHQLRPAAAVVPVAGLEPPVGLGVAQLAGDIVLGDGARRLFVPAQDERRGLAGTQRERGPRLVTLELQRQRTRPGSAWRRRPWPPLRSARLSGG